MVPDENSMNDPLCNSAIGSMVSLDYVTPNTGRRNVQVDKKGSDRSQAKFLKRVARSSKHITVGEN